MGERKGVICCKYMGVEHDGFYTITRKLTMLCNKQTVDPEVLLTGKRLNGEVGNII